MASVKWRHAALDNLDRLDPLVRERILAKVSWFEENFFNVVPEKLHRDLKGLYKIRVGDYRVVYSLRGGVIAVEAVGHRRDIYR